MDDSLLNGLDDLTSTSSSKPKAKAKTPEVVDSPLAHLAPLFAKTKLYAVKNVGDHDLVTDWDLPLMPEDLKDKFQQYLNKQYLQYKLDETLAKVRMVAVLVGGRTINFLHDFMTQSKIPMLEVVQEGMETKLKSQFTIPKEATVVVTEEQMTSLRKFVKRRAVSKTGEKGSWAGILAVKEIAVEHLPKLKYSMVTENDVRNNNFELNAKKLVTTGINPNMEYSEELDDLID